MTQKPYIYAFVLLLAICLAGLGCLGTHPAVAEPCPKFKAAEEALTYMVNHKNKSTSRCFKRAVKHLNKLDKNLPEWKDQNISVAYHLNPKSALGTSAKKWADTQYGTCCSKSSNCSHCKAICNVLYVHKPDVNNLPYYCHQYRSFYWNFK